MRQAIFLVQFSLLIGRLSCFLFFFMPIPFGLLLGSFLHRPRCLFFSLHPGKRLLDDVQ
jgi:hypothetical protein